MLTLIGKETKICLRTVSTFRPGILIPILELYQNPDGSITVPEVLRQYMNGKEKITQQ